MRKQIIASIGLIVSMLSCTEPTGPLDTAETKPTATPLASLSTGSPTGFYFLSPLAAKTTFSGVFDATLSPSVDICLPAGQGCSLPLIASYTMTSGVGSEVIRVSASEGQYSVNWHTGKFTLVKGTVYRILVKVGGTKLGYTDVTISSSPPKGSLAETKVLQNGKTLPIQFRIETGAVPAVGAPQAILQATGAVTQAIGTAGGTISLTSHDVVYTLTIPAGALIATQNIALTPLAGITNFPLSGGVAAGVDFAPEGLVFFKPATLTMEFPAGSNLQQVYGFGYTGNGSAIFLKLDSKNGNTITMSITHFSGAGAGGASLVDINALVQSLSVNNPAELYPTVMKQAQIQLSQLVCGGPDVVFDCDATELITYQTEWDVVVEEVLRRWYDDRLKGLLTGATASDAALSDAGKEFSSWKSSIQLVYGSNEPQSLDSRSTAGTLLQANAYQASLDRAGQACADSVAVQQLGKIILLDLDGYDIGNGKKLPADVEDLAKTNSCTSFQTSGLSTPLPRDTTDTLRIEVIRAVGSNVTKLPWPEPITVRLLPTANGAVCGSVMNGMSFTDVMDPVSGILDVTLSTRSMPAGCTEIVFVLSTQTYVPGTSPPPGLFHREVFGAEDTVHVPLPSSVVVSPSTALVTVGQTKQFTALVADGGGATWSATGGSITTSGLYSAGGVSGNFIVVATSIAYPTKSDTAHVTIGAVNVVVSPTSATVAIGGTQQFTANTGVTWSTTGGSISVTGLYTAGSTAGQFFVTATSIADPSLNTTIQVTVTAATTDLRVTFDYSHSVYADQHQDPSYVGCDSVTIRSSGDRGPPIPLSETANVNCSDNYVDETYGSGNSYSAQATVSRSYSVSADANGVQYIKVNANSSGTASETDGPSPNLNARYANSEASLRTRICFSTPFGRTYQYELTGTLVVSGLVDRSLGRASAFFYGRDSNGEFTQWFGAGPQAPNGVGSEIDFPSTQVVSRTGTFAPRSNACLEVIAVAQSTGVNSSGTASAELKNIQLKFTPVP